MRLRQPRWRRETLLVPARPGRQRRWKAASTGVRRLRWQHHCRLLVLLLVGMLMCMLLLLLLLLQLLLDEHATGEVLLKNIKRLNAILH